MKKKIKVVQVSVDDLLKDVEMQRDRNRCLDEAWSVEPPDIPTTLDVKQNKGVLCLNVNPYTCQNKAQFELDFDTGGFLLFCFELTMGAGPCYQGTFEATDDTLFLTYTHEIDQMVDAPFCNDASMIYKTFDDPKAQEIKYRIRTGPHREGDVNHYMIVDFDRDFQRSYETEKEKKTIGFLEPSTAWDWCRVQWDDSRYRRAYAFSVSSPMPIEQYDIRNVIVNFYTHGHGRLLSEAGKKHPHFPLVLMDQPYLASLCANIEPLNAWNRSFITDFGRKDVVFPIFSDAVQTILIRRSAPYYMLWLRWNGDITLVGKDDDECKTDQEKINRFFDYRPTCRHDSSYTMKREPTRADVDALLALVRETYTLKACNREVTSKFYNGLKHQLFRGFRACSCITYDILPKYEPWWATDFALSALDVLKTYLEYEKDASDDDVVAVSKEEIIATFMYRAEAVLVHEPMESMNEK